MNLEALSRKLFSAVDTGVSTLRAIARGRPGEEGGRFVELDGRSDLFHLMTANAHVAPTLVTLHQGLPDKPIEHESLLGQLLDSAAWVTACSGSVLTHAQKLVPEIAPRSFLIYNGLAEPSFNPRPISFDPP